MKKVGNWYWCSKGLIILCQFVVFGCGSYEVPKDFEIQSEVGVKKASDGNRVESLSLVNTETGQDIRILDEGDTINLNSFDHGLSIRANTIATTDVTIAYINGSEVNRDARESKTLNGIMSNGELRPYEFKIGSIEVEFVPSSKINRRWTRAEPYRLNLNIVREPIAPEYSGPGNQVSSLMLVNTTTGQNIKRLDDGETLNLGSFNHGLSIRANTVDQTDVTIAEVNGREVNRGARNSKTLSGLNSNGTIRPYDFPLGNLVVTFIPSSKINGTWTRGVPFEIRLNIIEDTTQPGPIVSPNPEPDPIPAPNPEPTQGNYQDDTYVDGSNAPVANAVGRFDYARYLQNGSVNSNAYSQYRTPSSGSGRMIVDMKDLHYLVDNNDESIEPRPNSSTSARGNNSSRCTDGNSPINRYPVDIRRDNTTLHGGVVHGNLPMASPHAGVPQNADWYDTYCNSAAIHFKDARGGQVDGVRITGYWDAIRVEDNFVVENSWFSGGRDDVIENDKNQGGVFQDNLVEDTFVAFSSRGGASNGSNKTFRVHGNVIKLKSTRYKAYESSRPDQQMGSFLKYDNNAPRTQIRNTVLAIEIDAIEPGGSVGLFAPQWDTGWSKVTACENNVLLWITNSNRNYDSTLNRAIQRMPSGCFQVFKGQQAKNIYEAAKRNWINCHGKTDRINGDQNSNLSQCQSNTWGGYSYSN